MATTKLQDGERVVTAWAEAPRGPRLVQHASLVLGPRQGRHAEREGPTARRTERRHGDAVPLLRTGVAEYVEGPDAALIAAYRTAAPELADRLERAMAEVERLRRSLTNLAIIHERRGA
jgi:hypothetical protein